LGLETAFLGDTGEPLDLRGARERDRVDLAASELLDQCGDLVLVRFGGIAIRCDEVRLYPACGAVLDERLRRIRAVELHADAPALERQGAERTDDACGRRLRRLDRRCNAEGAQRALRLRSARQRGEGLERGQERCSEARALSEADEPFDAFAGVENEKSGWRIHRSLE